MNKVHVCYLLTRKATVQLMCSFVLSLWTIAALLIYITSDQMYCLQKIQNYAAKVVFRKANMSVLHHFSKRFNGSQSKKGYFSR